MGQFTARTACAAVLAMLIGSQAMGIDRPMGELYSTRSVVMARQGMAATSQPLATQIALSVLKDGGTAVDAAIAANAALGLMEPTGNGIGGDLFALVWDGETNQLYGLNGSGRSPGGLTLAYFNAHGVQSIPPFGPLSVSVPGAVDGWFTLHRRFGRLPMQALLAPAIRYAEDGFPVSPVIADTWERNAEALESYPGFADVFMPGGKAPAAGEVFRNPGLANTYRRLAEHGRDGFYTGEVAKTIEQYMGENGGFLTAEDLAEHRSEWVTPVATNYRGYDVWELPPNGQGIAALQMLNVLEGYDVGALTLFDPDYIHLLVEAKKLAFEDRARFYFDPDFGDVPIDALISKSYAAKRRQLIDPNKAATTYGHGEPAALAVGDTIYLTVADSEGTMVSLIQSNYRGMGSGMTPPGLGFVLQDRGELFSLDPQHPNAYEPGKRPFHTIIPAFVTRDGKPWLAFGVMGGAMQPQAHVQVLVNLIDFGMGLQQAGDAPRIYHGGSSQPTGTSMQDGGWVSLETAFGVEVREALATMGHHLKDVPGVFGGYQAIMWNAQQGVYYGASESRKDGHAAGY
jgi:gamma-glutamyltranspeptidase/glutathione hydrolase